MYIFLKGKSSNWMYFCKTWKFPKGLCVKMKVITTNRMNEILSERIKNSKLKATNVRRDSQFKKKVETLRLKKAQISDRANVRKQTVPQPGGSNCKRSITPLFESQPWNLSNKLRNEGPYLVFCFFFQHRNCLVDSNHPENKNNIVSFLPPHTDMC